MTSEIILDGQTYKVSDFSESVQALVNVRTKWEGDLAEERAAVLKTESAIHSLDIRLTKLITEELTVQTN
jgi:hypothetical protein